MDPKIQFLFYLGAVICFGLAAFGSGIRFGGRAGGALNASVGLVPLGLLLFVFPTLWTVGEQAF